MTFDTQPKTLVIIHEDVLVHKPSIVSLSILAEYDLPDTLSALVIMTNERPPEMLRPKPRNVHTVTSPTITKSHRIYFQKMDESEEDMASLFTANFAMRPPTDMLVILAKSKSAMYFRRPDTVDSVRLCFVNKGSVGLDKLATLVRLKSKFAHVKEAAIEVGNGSSDGVMPKFVPTPSCQLDRSTFNTSSPISCAKQDFNSILAEPSTANGSRSVRKSASCTALSTRQNITFPTTIGNYNHDLSNLHPLAKKCYDNPFSNVTDLHGIDSPRDFLHDNPIKLRSGRYSDISTELWEDTCLPSTKIGSVTPPASPTSSLPSIQQVSHTQSKPGKLELIKEESVSQSWYGWRSTTSLLSGIQTHVMESLSLLDHDPLLVSVVGRKAITRVRSNKSLRLQTDTSISNPSQTLRRTRSSIQVLSV
ncbi:hypothetical protein QVD99_003081 [Batrachochytrium dendrobatidis]|nr:hypothetical protein O5D80_001759 [Batrachochytrium dendrobatidis]KAK5670393.1 hypothetical protein QVD99_003081 [Batrachochytrium dendrobatidis]